MFRTLIYLLLALFVLMVIRMMAGVLLKGAGSLFESARPEPGAPRPTPSQTPPSGELKRDPVCGTFVPTATSVKKSVHGETVHFCSTDCRDRYTTTA